MKALLVYPYFLDPRLNAEDIRDPPIGLYHVAAALLHHGHEVKVLNCHERRPPDEFLELLREYRPDVVGFSILHANRWGGIEMARAAKKAAPRVPVVFGGVGATHLWQHLLTHFAEIDYIVLGEGEHAFLELVGRLEAGETTSIGDIAGLAFRREGLPEKTAAADPVCELDTLPMPGAWFDVAHVALTRGCVSNCAFCGSPAFWGRRVRSHSADYFVGHLAALRERGRRFFYVSDDTFTLDRRRAIEVCRLILRRRLDISWAAISRVDAIDEEVLAWLRRAGCIQISYGVESGSAAIRKRLNKRIGERAIRAAFELTQRYGIMARAYFIYGCPGETRQTIQETIDLMLAIKPLGAVFYILDIFPGTALCADMKRRLRVDDDIWLRRVEDIMYFETDPALSAEMVLEFGKLLRGAFYGNLQRFVEALAPLDEPEFYPLHADFFSRLAMTFHQGDYARVEAVADKPALSEALYRRALSYHPDARAYLGLGLLRQTAGRFEESIRLLAEGIDHFPEAGPLKMCSAVSHMNLGRYDQALELLRRCPGEPQAERLAEACLRAGGRKGMGKGTPPI